jgi:hypothetical protein
MLEQILEDQAQPSFKTKQMILYLQTHLHTFAVQDKCDSMTPNSDCRFYIITYIPILSKKQKYESYHIDVLPVLKQGLVTDDWIQIQIPEKRMLLNDHQLRIIDPDDYWCYSDQNVPCQVCVTRKIEHSIPSVCFRNILQQSLLQEILKFCDYVKLANIWNKAIFLTEFIMAYVNPKPGSLVEKCPTKDPVNYQLLPYGYINLSSTCLYDMVNGPLNPDDEYISSLTVMNNIAPSTVSISEFTSEDAVRSHFRYFAVEYILALFLFSLFLFISIIFYICFKDRIKQCRFRRRVSRSSRVRPPRPALIPTAPQVASSNNNSNSDALPQTELLSEPYNLVRAQLGNLVRQQLAISQI